MGGWRYVCGCDTHTHTHGLSHNIKRQSMNRSCGLNGETTNKCITQAHTPCQNVFNFIWTACGKCCRFIRFINVIDCFSNCQINLMCGHELILCKICTRTRKHTKEMCSFVSFLYFWLIFSCKSCSSWSVSEHWSQMYCCNWNQWEEAEGIELNRKRSSFYFVLNRHIVCVCVCVGKLTIHVKSLCKQMFM